MNHRIQTAAMLALISLPFVALGLLLSYLVIQAVYNVFFHPLRHYPRAPTNKANLLMSTYHAWNGLSVKHISALHERYGEVVRVSPNELSYITSQAWQDISGHRNPSTGQGNLPKEDRNRRPDANGTPSILTANDQDHRRMRRLQSHAFSDKSLKEQEPLITGYVDKLISRLHERAANAEMATLDLVKWYNYTTFDILGDLAFGDSFNCLESDILHPWIANLFRSIKDAVYYRIARNFPTPIFELMRHLQPQGLSSSRAEEFAFASQKARERMNQGATDRVDFMSYILKHNDEKGMTPKEIESNASLLIIAGSETMIISKFRLKLDHQQRRISEYRTATIPATFLSGITYNLLRTPHVLKKLTELVRTTFLHESDIDIVSIQQLEYFTACLEEGFRTYPPVPSGTPRKTTSEGNTINNRYVPRGVTVYVTQWAAYRSSRNFADPNSFIPDRWLKDPPARYVNDNTKVLCPFSVGPRNCIGRNLAYAEMRLILARMLWNFDMELQSNSLNWDDQKIFSLWEKVPLYVKLIPRKI